MIESALLLLFSLVLILGACELFINGLEWTGYKLSLNEGVVGSIFAAVGTAMPETMIPLIAVFFQRDGVHGSSVGIGAILGAPFMLATLAMFVSGLTVAILALRGQRGLRLNVNTSILSRDIRFFVAAFSVAIAAAVVEGFIWKLLAVLTEVVLYVIYVYRHATDVHEAQEEVELDALHFARKAVEPHLRIVFLQVLFGILFIVLGAYLFVENIVVVAEGLGMPALLLSLIVAPIATELPEKFNSILWISRGKDTLALGNVTGAMVFQSAIPTTLGILLTDWAITSQSIYGFASVAVAFASVFSVFGPMHLRNRLTATMLLFGGFWYVAYFGYLWIAGYLQLLSEAPR